MIRSSSLLTFSLLDNTNEKRDGDDAITWDTSIEAGANYVNVGLIYGTLEV